MGFQFQFRGHACLAKACQSHPLRKGKSPRPWENVRGKRIFRICLKKGKPIQE
ncbi:hypothetical protein LEP1GSC061_4133 [Leptospira wolffii serovar Khorat str. Khorat-H2]|nr:hypothetical protein LEP1GSC061_4133 [Leptospira wolffii serovar Khorat str. Khorat-H2]